MSWLYQPLLPGAAQLGDSGGEESITAATMIGLYQMITTASDSFSRPANTTTYAANDLVANSATAGSVVPLTFTTSKLGSGRAIVRRVRFFKDSATTTAAVFNLHLFTQAPTVTNGDNGAFAVNTSRYFIGTVAMDASSGGFVVTSTDLLKCFAVSPEMNFDLGHVSPSERKLYGLLETGSGGTYAPASGETFEVTLELASVE